MLFVIAIYFSFRPRLVLPVYLLMLPAACEAVLWSLRKFGARVATPATWAVAALVAVPQVLDFEPGKNEAGLRRAQVSRMRLLAYVEDTLPPGAPIAAPLGWHLGADADRPVYNLQIVSQRLGLEPALELIPRHGIVAVVANQRNKTGIRFAAVLRERYGPGRRVGDWAVFDTR
jgi:hypothetical protein